jgi:hypothetical protein
VRSDFKGSRSPNSDRRSVSAAGSRKLLDGDDAEAEIIHPYAIRGGEPAERELAAAAAMAAREMVTDGQFNWSAEQGYHLLPVRKHIAKATVAEVRLSTALGSGRDIRRWFAASGHARVLVGHSWWKA